MYFEPQNHAPNKHHWSLNIYQIKEDMAMFQMLPSKSINSSRIPSCIGSKFKKTHICDTLSFHVKLSQTKNEHMPMFDNWNASHSSHPNPTKLGFDSIHSLHPNQLIFVHHFHQKCIMKQAWKHETLSTFCNPNPLQKGFISVENGKWK